ncbi:MAG: AI-2E family transporter [Clostridia bacterium]|nr:AI-2E family transporter [Clostridia bacterium]
MNFFQKNSKVIVAFVFACAVIFVYKTFDNLGNIFESIGTVLKAFTPFFIGFVIAYILNMPSKKFAGIFKKSKKAFLNTHSYGIGVACSYVLAIVLVVIAISAVIPALSKNIIEIYNNMPTYVKSIEGYLNDIEVLKTINLVGEDGLDIYSTINSMIAKIDISQFGKYAEGVASITSGVLNIFIAIISSIYMLLDKERIVEAVKVFMRTIFKESTANSIIRHAGSINQIFINYIYSRLICCVIIGVASGIALTIIGVKYALLLAIFVGLMDMIPYFGSIISCVVAILVALVTGGLWKAIWSAGVLFVLQQLDGNVLAPKVMGETLEIRPLWIICAVTVGGSLFGFWGMLISVPVVAVIKAIVSEYWGDFAEKRNTKDKDGSAV